MKKPHSCAGKVLVCLWLASFGIPRPAPAQTTSQAVTLCQQDRFAEATRILRTIIDNPSKPDQQRAEASTALSSCQQRLVGSWSSLVSFFTSAASRLQARSLTTFRSETIFQLTPDQESRMGDEAFAMLRTLVRPASDPEAESFVRQITSRLVSASPGLAGNVQVALIDTQDIAAPSLPGKVVATTALLRFAASETDLAAAIAHDLGHAYAHHAARRLLSEMQQQALINRLVSAVTRHNDLLAKANTIIASSASKLISTAFGAAEESEADRYAEHLLFNAGYDPRALPKILEEMARSGSAGVRVPPDRALVAAGYASAFPTVPNKLRDDSAAFSQIKGRYQGSGPIPAPALAGAQPMESPAVTTPAVKATQPAESATPAAAAPAAAMRPTPSATVASAPPQPLPPPAHTSQPRVTQVPAQPAQPPPAAPTPASAGAPPQPPPVPASPPVPAPPPAPVPPPATRTEPVAVPAVPSQPALLKPPAAVPDPAPAPLSPSVMLPSPPPPVPAPSPATQTAVVAAPEVPPPTVVLLAPSPPPPPPPQGDAAAAPMVLSQPVSLKPPAAPPDPAPAPAPSSVLPLSPPPTQAEIVAAPATLPPSPASTPAIRDEPKATSIWESYDSAMRIVLRNTGGVVDAIVQVVPTTWSSTHVRAGDVVFRDGHADENGNIRGTFITVPPEGQCPQLPAAFAPAELVVNSESGTLAITMQLKVLVASECRWMDGPLRRTTTWRRVPGLGD